MTVQMLHNPRCSKSRATLALLQERGIEPEVIHYLENPLNAAAIRRLVKQLELSTARDLMRVNETLYNELGLKNATSEKTLIEAMANNPILIERPVVINGDRAAIGRPPEAVLKIF